MTLEASIYRFLSVRKALSKADFRPLSSPIFIIHVTSSFRIGIYRKNSPSIVFVSMSRVFCNLLIFKVNKVDFVCIFIDRNGPRFEHTSTMYCKYQVSKQLPSRIYDRARLIFSTIRCVPHVKLRRTGGILNPSHFAPSTCAHVRMCPGVRLRTAGNLCVRLYPYWWGVLRS